MTSDTLLAAKFLSFMLSLAVMLFQLSVERVKAWEVYPVASDVTLPENL